jgi:hypothetical protein
MLCAFCAKKRRSRQLHHRPEKGGQLHGEKSRGRAIQNNCRGVEKVQWLHVLQDHFSVLNAMYALIAVKGARIAKQEGNKLFFNIWKGGV